MRISVLAGAKKNLKHDTQYIMVKLNSLFCDNVRSAASNGRITVSESENTRCFLAMVRFFHREAPCGHTASPDEIDAVSEIALPEIQDTPKYDDFLLFNQIRCM
ncbi:unnamed protein product [Albugo candida]|uniref:Uncharacterized protein n=1 Tax=Albugo candida TaxID=65357 RepID=A0A024GPN8_9STRA|nr:unnamed protein product [Albugo candida]|eukprot:CCI48483.1 unnamed protein product [Albugo candida]